MPKPFNIPATGVVEYQNFVIDTGWKEDRWITAIEPKPGNPAVVHHILIFVKSPEGVALGLGSDNDFIGALRQVCDPCRCRVGWRASSRRDQS